MKYIGTAFLVFAIYWSWGLARHDQAISQQVHTGIQDELKKLIADYIQQNLPNSTNLNFERFWTEALNENQVQASFIYSFEDSSEQTGKSRVQIEGSAILNRVPEDNKTVSAPAVDKEEDKEEASQKIEWSLDKIEILNNQIDYQDPMNVQPNEGKLVPAPEAPAEKEKSNSNHE